MAFAGALSDPIEEWVRCGPLAPSHTIINGELVVDGGELVADRSEEILRDHRRIATAMQAD